MDVGHNQFTGTLDMLSTLTGLSVLGFCGNALSGQMPAFLTGASFHLTDREVSLSDPACAGTSDQNPYVDRCDPGYYCDANSLSYRANVCPAGTYSAGNTTTCSPCAAGYFGNTSGLTTPQCTAACQSPLYSPAGSQVRQ